LLAEVGSSGVTGIRVNSHKIGESDEVRACP
jgi:hypothetical protein